MKKNMKNDKDPLAIERGKRVKNEAKRRRLTQKQLENDLHMSISSIRKIYQGDHLLSEIQAEYLAEYFGVRKEFLLCQDDARTEEDKRKRDILDSIQNDEQTTIFNVRLINEACSLTSFSYGGFFFPEDSVRVNLVNPSLKFYDDQKNPVIVDQSPIDSWRENVFKYAAFTLDLLLKDVLSKEDRNNEV